MSRNPAIIVEYIDKDGNTQKGITRQIDQVAEIVKANKVLVRLVHPNLTPMLDDNGKERVVLKSAELLAVYGYSD
ncbi:MAG: hypothetical protein JZU65_19365 [Chlorobium sp.]|jgi:hypothetical protein|nr:hypothetical protein [Chlorobium sp.]